MMTRSARERMVDSAVVLLAQRGFQGASFTEVLAHSKAPRGSIYHHFPAGKEQLIAAAVDYAGARAVVLLDALDGLSAAEMVDAFMAMWRAVLERSGFTAGCSVLAVTVSADSAELLARAGEVFRAWQARLAALFADAGLAGDDADGLATLMIAASEGAVVLARAQQALAPLETVHRQLRRLAEAYSPGQGQDD
ncbi:MAG TPA: TetR/AcrR family transcriptional regulator [Streptosporangiaceae bacterium]|jgi:AcrR family transcriptional regulator